MNNKKRSWKQIVLMILSILALIAGVGTLILGIAFMRNNNAIAAFLNMDSTGFSFRSILIIINGVVILLAGICGIVGAVNGRKIFPFIVFAFIAFVMALFFQEQAGGGLIRQLINGNFNPYSLLSVLFEGTMFGLGISIRRDYSGR